MMNKKTILILFTMICIISLSACNTNDEEQTKEKQQSNDSAVETAGNMEEDASKQIFVSLKDRKQQEVATATLTQEEDGVRIQLSGQNFTPGKHGFHIHETGACEGPDFSSAGGHFNPTNVSHGNVEDGPHAGDLPNMEVKEDGTVQADTLAEMVTLEKGKPNSLLKEDGTALIIHSDEDDYKSQPAGNAGERIACGVIQEGE